MTKQFEYAIDKDGYIESVLRDRQNDCKDELKRTSNSHSTETLKLRIRQLQSAIKTLQQDKAEVIAEGVVGLDKTENSFYLDDFNFKYVVQLIEARINELIGKQVKLILIKKGERTKWEI